MMHLLLYSFYHLLYTVYFGVVTTHKIFFLGISMSSLLCIQIFFFKISLHTKLKQTNQDKLTF